MFALDLQGHPHYVYHKWGDGLNKELHLLSCDAANCAAAAGWHDLTIASESYAFEDEYLAYTADGKIRLVCTHAGDTEIAPDETLGFSYWECDSGCTTSATGWRRVHIYPSDYPMGFALGPQGQPRALIYGSGNYGASPAIQPDTYNYVWCNTNCLSAGNWHASTIGSPAGEVPDIYQQESTRLAIDGTGRPYVAYYYEDPQTYDNTGLRWYYCPQNCQVEGNNAANWHKQFIETVRTLDASDPIPVEPGYLVSVWSHPGRFPRLAFDVAGNVQTVYGNWHQQMRWNGSSIESYVDLALARLRLLKRP